MIVLEIQLADRALTGGECEASSVPIKCVLNPDWSGSGLLMYLRDLSQFTKPCFPYSYRHLCSTWICYPGTAERLELKTQCRAEMTEEPFVLQAQITRLWFVSFPSWVLLMVQA